MHHEQMNERMNDVHLFRNQSLRVRSFVRAFVNIHFLGFFSLRTVPPVYSTVRYVIYCSFYFYDVVMMTYTYKYTHYICCTCTCTALICIPTQRVQYCTLVTAFSIRALIVSAYLFLLSFHFFLYLSVYLSVCLCACSNIHYQAFSNYVHYSYNFLQF